MSGTKGLKENQLNSITEGKDLLMTVDLTMERFKSGVERLLSCAPENQTDFFKIYKKI